MFIKSSILNHIPVFEIRENNHCGGVIFQAGKPESMLKSSTSTVIISSYFEHCILQCVYASNSIGGKKL